jgi:hypothetical protein
MMRDELREQLRVTEAILRGFAAAKASGLPVTHPDTQRMIARDLYGDDEDRFAAHLTTFRLLADNATITVTDEVTGVGFPVRIRGQRARDRN